MKTYRIGVPRLAALIEKSTPRRTEIPIKTLQRFLGGYIRTNDAYVAIFRDFAFSSEQEADPLGDMGRAMAAYYGATDSSEYGGEYRAFFPAQSESHIDREGQVQIVADKGFCRVVETSKTLFYTHYHGVLIQTKNATFMQLKDLMTGMLKHYIFGTDGKKYAGRGASMRYSPVHAIEERSAEVVWDAVELERL